NSENDVNVLLATVASNRLQKMHERRAWHVKLGEHFAAFLVHLRTSINLRMVISDVGGQLLCVRPVQLTRCGDIIIRVQFEGFFLVGVREIGESLPVFGRERLLAKRHRAVVRYGTISGSYAAAQKTLRFRVGHVLEVAIERTVAYALFEGRDKILQIDDFDNALDLLPQSEAQLNGCDYAEESIAADGQSKELGIFAATTRPQRAVRVHEDKRFYVRDYRFEAQTSTVCVRGERAANAQLIGSGLFLEDAPLSLFAFLLCY